MERILAVLGEPAAPARRLVAVVPIGAAQEPGARRFLYALRRSVPAEIVAGDASLGKKLRVANEIGARFAVIFGEEEARAGRPLLKDMESGEQAAASEDEIVARVASIASSEESS
jgi:histidyl-tRNA synthetase